MRTFQRTLSTSDELLKGITVLPVASKLVETVVTNQVCISSSSADPIDIQRTEIKPCNLCS